MQIQVQQNLDNFLSIPAPKRHVMHMPHASSLETSCTAVAQFMWFRTPLGLGQATLVFVLYVLIPGISICLATRSILQGANEAG